MILEKRAERPVDDHTLSLEDCPTKLFLLILIFLRFNKRVNVSFYTVGRYGFDEISIASSVRFEPRLDRSWHLLFYSLSSTVADSF